MFKMQSTFKNEESFAFSLWYSALRTHLSIASITMISGKLVMAYLSAVENTQDL